jgi:hypothetical protein
MITSQQAVPQPTGVFWMLPPTLPPQRYLPLRPGLPAGGPEVRPPSVGFGAKLTPQTVADQKLKALVAAMEQKRQAGQLVLPGAVVSTDADAPDQAQLVVIDPAKGDRIYWVSKFTKMKDGLFEVTSFVFTQYEQGSAFKKPLRHIRLIPDQGQDWLIYEDLTQQPIQAPVLKTNNPEITGPFRRFLAQLERDGLFDPNPTLKQEEGDQLEF